MHISLAIKDMIFIRTDANEVMASGHMMRCLSIASEIKAIGENVEFIISDHRSEELLNNSGFRFRHIDSDWRNPDFRKETDQIKQLFSDYQKERTTILVDSYYITNKYFKYFNDDVKTAYIDDLFKEKYDIDLLINYNIFYDIFDYEIRYASSRTKLLLGTEYVPLRRQFVRGASGRKSEKFTKDGLNVLMMSGGGDPYHVLLNLLKYGDIHEIFDRKNKYHVVAGTYNPDTKELCDLAKKLPDVMIYDRVDDMASLMEMCDIAVSAAGTTLYECCTVGIPTIIYCMVDNQKYDGMFFSRDAKMLYAGDLRFDREKVISNIFSHILYLVNNSEARMAMRSSMIHLIDGHGAERIAKVLTSL